MSLKVGDKVKLNPESKYANGFSTNPINTLGVIVELDHNDDALPITAEWSNGRINSYHDTDLILQEEVETKMVTNKIGELIIDWDELEVGDKAIFEGYTRDTANDADWRYTVGKTYTVEIDEEGDKGFIEDLDHKGVTWRCPLEGLDRFKFRLISKAQSAFPDFSFKLRNGDKLEVRQWLKDNGVAWSSGRDIFDHRDQPYILVKGAYASHFDNDLRCFTETDLPEIRLEIQPAKVLGYSLVEKVEQKSEKELQLEEIVAKLQSQLNEAQTELKSIK